MINVYTLEAALNNQVDLSVWGNSYKACSVWTWNIPQDQSLCMSPMFKYLQTICSNRRADSHQGIFIPAIPSQRANEVAYWQEVLQHTTRVTLKILFRKPIRYGPGRVACLVCGRFSAFSTFKTAMGASCLIPPAALWYALCQLSLQWPLIITELQALMSMWVGVCLCVCSNSLQ